MSQLRASLSVVLLLSCPAFALAQAGGATQACQRLEAQLATVDQGGTDPNRAEQARRYEEATSRQQAELDKLVAQSRRQGCERSGGFFSSVFGNSVFNSGGDGAQCTALDRRIDQMRNNLDRMQSELQQASGSNLERGEQRRRILIALSENNCGPQYRSASGGGRGFFETVFGGNSIISPGEQQGSGYRTVCVRTCDGYFFPVSFAVNQSKFRDDERVCQRMCPAAEVSLYTYRNPGEDINQAVSLSSGQPYTALPTAFRYRQQVDAACSCRKTGQSWGEALKSVDDNVEQGDIVVNDERARRLSQPPSARPARNDGRTSRADVRPEVTGSTPKQDETATDAEPAKRSVRSVGPRFIPPENVPVKPADKAN